ncbi:zinc-binding alcohol dehydrogenase family protein [Pigmentiphaga aceris]|uniref:Zinc-binding alcohol dehydrogenase family protein n=1 Tax=Pigmentiphaga aceris TaxID=1940612 RepID=A0A5C0B1K1_9BURK|nr:zinc-binding alcohol dehydrogenase family protein [Pigmentiphaga aceris]QEI07643.1 zinc-binding alcohol dehydrogenase family protein [Pigmentiphaga aceris]
MLTVTCETPGTLRAIETERPVRGEGEVLLRIKRVGVCGTDLHIFSGNQPYLQYPRVMGHEISAIVEEAIPGGRLSVGDVVYVMPYIACGACIACRQGKTNCCTKLQVLGVHRDGALTELLSLPEAYVHKAEGVTLDQAAMVEFLAIGAHAVRRAQVKQGQRVLVVGAGPIGMAAMIFARINGATVTAIDGRQDRLDFCTRELGVAHAIALGPNDTEQLSAATDGEFFDVVFDATGNAKAIERGFGFVAHAGSYVLISIVRDNITFSDPEFHKRETTLLGSRNATTEDFEAVLAAIRAGEVPTDALNTHRLKLAELPTEFEKLLDPARGVVKAIVEL